MLHRFHSARHTGFGLAGDRRRRRTLVVLAAACAAILLAGVVVAQASQNYDLACRGVIDSGGGYRVTPSNSVAIVDATGQPLAGLAKSSSYGIYGGYIHPYKPYVPSSPPSPPAQTFDNEWYLPLIAKGIRIIRGC